MQDARKTKKGNRRDVQEIVGRVSCAALGQQSVFDSGLQHPVRKRDSTGGCVVPAAVVSSAPPVANDVVGDNNNSSSVDGAGGGDGSV